MRKEPIKKLVFEDDFYSTFEPIRRGFGLKQEPFIIENMFGFTVYRDSISTETIYYLYEKYKEELGIEFDFHLAMVIVKLMVMLKVVINILEVTALMYYLTSIKSNYKKN